MSDKDPKHKDIGEKMHDAGEKFVHGVSDSYSRGLRKTRFIRMAARIFLLVLTTSMSLVSFLGGMSALIILTNEDNITFGDNPEFYLDPEYTNNWTVEFDFKLNNAGYFDLEDLEIEVWLFMKYNHVNLTGDGINRTNTIQIYHDEHKFKDIERGTELKTKYKSESENFNTDDIPDVDEVAINLDDLGSTAIKFYADIRVKAKYSLGLLEFEAFIEDFDIGTYSMEDLIDA